MTTPLLGPFGRSIKRRNSFFDALFYDISSLSADERGSLSPRHDREGSIIVVPPSGSGRKIRHYRQAESFLATQRDKLRALVVAGVGSSALGTAALARNVADAYDMDVAGVVSGYGAADLVTEAMGGWLFYGAADAIRHQVRTALGYLDKAWEMNPFVARSNLRSAAPLPMTGDIAALNTILAAEPPNLQLLLGHSKGNMILDFALERFVATQGDFAHAYYRDLTVVTLGAVANLPAAFQRVHQFIGQLDWFGGINSRMEVEHDRVGGAWHHLNTEFPLHLPTQQVLREQVVLA